MRQPKNRLSFYFIAFVTTFCLISCQPITFTEQDIPCQNKKVIPVSSENPLDIALNVDGSGSMFGYVSTSKSRYTRTLKLLDDVLSGEGSRKNKPNLNYYRSGNNQNQQLTGRNQYLDATKPIFYTGKNPKYPAVTSQLDRIITPITKGDRLLIFVTDLEQNDGDINNLINKLQNNYLNKNTPQYVLGILAVKSEFKGTIFSTNPDTYSNKPYNTDGKKMDKYRPFYVLFIGTNQDVKYYYQQMLNRDQDLIQSSKFVIFSPYSFVEGTTQIKLETTLPNEISTPFSLQQDNIAFEPNTNSGESSYLLFEVNDQEEKKIISLPYKLSFTPLGYNLKATQLEVEPKIQVSDSFEKKFVDQSDNAGLQQAVSINNLKLAAQNVSLKTKIDPSQFPKPAIYLFSFDLAIKNLEDERWWQDWDWGSSKHSKNQQSDGSKTYQFLDFMTSLKSRMTDGEKPVLTRICYAIQKN
jgi:hypothetical protein